jgi:hypothetical protein
MTDNDADAMARATAHALIHGYLGPDHKVINMAAFYSALVQALKEAQTNRNSDEQTSSSLKRIL